MILRLLCIWLVFYSLLSSLILSNLKHELLNRLRSTMAANVLISYRKVAGLNHVTADHASLDVSAAKLQLLS
jgi:hypothetical protein